MSLVARLLRALLLLACLGALPAAAQTRAPQPWKAKWIAHPDAPPQAAGVFHFRRTLSFDAAPKRYVVHVSADNRYRLFVNGKPVARGPARGDLMHWRYETIDLVPHLKPGRNVLAALVWNWGEHKPAAQISLRTAFLVRGEGPAEAAAETSPEWKVYWNKAYSFAPVAWKDSGGWYVASPGETVDAAHYPWGWETPGFDDSSWPAAAPVKNPPGLADTALPHGSQPYGYATEWQLVPRTIPQMQEAPTRLASVRRAEGVPADSGFLRGTGGLTIPANSKVSLLVDQGHLTMGHPVLTTSGGAGARAEIVYAEGLFDAANRKGNRDEVEGRTIRGLRDRIVFDGGTRRRFETIWLRTWRYIQLDIETAAEPLRIDDFHAIFTAYPFEQRASFTSDQPWIGNVWEIDWRMLRLSAFETFWDTPYYEQLQYVGDARIEALLSLYNAGDDRLMRNAIQLFDESRSAEGLTAGAWPSAIPAYLPPFSLWWVAMVHDYWMLRDDPAFVRGFIPGMRGVLAWYERHIDESGMLGPMPWWNFLDWNSAFPRGVPPGAEDGNSAPLTFQFAYTLRRAAEIEDRLGQPAEGARYRALADQLIAATRARTWDPARGLFADSPERKQFSQQTNALALLAGAVPAGERRALMERVLGDRSLVQASFYFRFYIDEAMREAGLADRYLERLAPWRDMIAIGLTTTPENPEPTRSDSHAWSAHPNYHLLATVLGVRPASPGFRTVTIEPAFGPMRRAEGRVPHPAGTIEVFLKREGDAGISGNVVLPQGLTGSFVWHEKRIELKSGKNAVRIQ